MPLPQVYGVQELLRPVVPGVNAQTPFWVEPPAFEQVWQLPVQADSQQKPSVQKPLWHWAAPVQGLPCGAGVPGAVHCPPLQTPLWQRLFAVQAAPEPPCAVHVPPLQKLPAPQSASMAQEEGQAGVEPLQTAGLQVAP